MITLPDLIEVLGPRPYPMKESMKEYLDELEKRMKDKKDNPQVNRPLEKKIEAVEEETE